MITTQLSGKFAIGDDGIFNFKRILEGASIIVKFPENDKIVGAINGIPVTFTPSKERTFYDVEIEFFQSIRNSKLHFVHNRSFNENGYIGKSTSIEMAYAIVQRKPIILIDEIKLAAHVPQKINDLIVCNKNSFFYHDISSFRKSQITDLMNSIPLEVLYECSIEDEIMVMTHVKDLLSGYH